MTSGGAVRVPSFGALVDVAERRMRELHVPGVALAMIADGHEESAGLGVADVRRPRAVTADTVFSIASITKTFTAGTLAAFARERLISLDDPVRRWVPRFRLADASATERVTIRHLLTHTGGWVGEELPAPIDGDDALTRAGEACARMRQVTTPGELFSYNNVGFIVAGAAIEGVTREPYETVVGERILRRLGMTRSAFAFPSDEDVAAEHTVRDDAPAVIEGWPTARSSAPVGGLRSTVRDLLRYARGHLDGSLELDIDASRAVPTGAPHRAQGIGWAITEARGTTMLSHGGATVAHMSLLLLVPAHRFALVVLTNGALGGQLTAAVAHRAVEDLGVETYPDPETRGAPDALVPGYLGRYEWPTSDIELVRIEGGLEMRLAWKGAVAARPAPAPVRLEFWDDTHVIANDGWAKGAFGDFPAPGLFRWGSRARPHA
ncbi:MAG TPA: serine hydrolase domain-containing protein [Candidatus Limnocylindria bacterium]